MRCSQPMGLPPEAWAFLEENVVEVDHGWKREPVGQYGMYGERHLWRYYLTDGRTAEERIQHEVWSSGPMTWLSLECGDIEFKWPEELMEE